MSETDINATSDQTATGGGVSAWEARRSKRGGKRSGAGRKPNYLKRLGIKAITAAEILAHHNEPDLWAGLLNHKSPDIRLRTLQYLVDRRDGKAKQAVQVSGGLLHAHTAYRDPLLAALTPEELKALDSLTRKLALPAPDGPHNQIESKPAVETTGHAEKNAGLYDSGSQTASGI